MEKWLGTTMVCLCVCVYRCLQRPEGDVESSWSWSCRLLWVITQGCWKIQLETSRRIGKICNTWAIASSSTVVLTCIVVRENHKFSHFQNILSFLIPSHSQRFFRQPGRDSLPVLVYEGLAVCKLSSSTRTVGALNQWPISPACRDCTTI